MHRPSRFRLLVLSALLLSSAAQFATPRGAAAKPVYFPPSESGWPGAIRDEMDVAPYLAFHKAQAFGRARAAATVPTPNQLAYDARFYDIDVTLTPSTSTVSGIVGMRAEVVNGPLLQLDLDLKANIIVDAVEANGLPTTFSRAGDVLTVNLERPYLNGEQPLVSVIYHGTPTGGYFGFSTSGGQPLIWSLSEPFGARTWWPCKDYPDDKADSVDIRITVPAGLRTASNGTRVLDTDNGSVAVTQWEERYPIATYLVSLASHPYTTYSDWYHHAPGDSMEIQFYVVPASAAAAAPENAKVTTMLAAFKPLFGEYPFLNEKYGHAEFPFGGGMEHQTCSSLGVYIEFVTAHELAHQWWGDMITCATFHHIWLNEGFATYSEALWAETQGGAAAYLADINQNRFFGAGSVYVPDVNDEARIFSFNLTYNKASWVLHMLRHVLGDSVFFASLAEYRNQYAYRSATTENFRDVCEQVSGKELDAFFQQWIYGEYYPAYRYTWTSTPAGGGGHDVTLTLEQSQTWQLFTMPVDVTVTTTAGPVTFVVQDSLASQQFVLHVNDPPTDVEIDRDGWILKTVENPVTDPQLDRAVLLVNGVDWANYGTEITSAYEDRAFWGNYSIDFWDVFPAPGGGYPSTVPAPLGHGAVPASVIGHYRNVIWLGNNFSGDLSAWQQSPILSYLEAGGNVLLMTRQGDQFVSSALKDYLGIHWTNTNVTLNDCVAAVAGLTDMTNIGAQTLCAVFDTVRTHADSDLLYRVVSGFSPQRGIGVLRRPAGGGTHRGNGGRFLFLSGRPYRRNHAQLAANVEYMLEHHFFETIDASGAGGGLTSARPPALRFDPPFPNPTRAGVTLRFALPVAGSPEIDVFDTLGRRVRALSPGPLDAGAHEITWPGFDDGGGKAAAGVYWARVRAAGQSLTRKVIVTD